MKDKTTIKFLLMVALCTVAGGALGITLVHLEMPLGQALETFSWFLARQYGWIQLLLLAVLGGAGASYYRKAKKLPTAPDDDEVFERGDDLLVKGLLSFCILTAVSFTLFGVFAVRLYDIVGGESATLFSFLWPVFVFGVTIAAAAAGEVAIIGITKKRNPEKRGNPLDRTFQKDWMESCDEAERYVVFNACYKSFMLMRICAAVCWVIGVLGGLFFGIGPLSAVLVGVLFGVQTVSYQVYVRQFSKKMIRE